MLSKPKFITFEGGEGSSKTTQAKMLYEYLITNNIPVILTREVGGCENAEKIRDLFLVSEMAASSELMLIMAARYEHVSQVIVPALLTGKWVICDRFIDSTACYQGANITQGIDLVYKLHDMIISPLFKDCGLDSLPNITFFMDITPENGLKRAKYRLNNNKFEEKILTFHQKIYLSFQNLVDKFPSRIIPIKLEELSKEQIHLIIKNLAFN